MKRLIVFVFVSFIILMATACGSTAVSATPMSNTTSVASLSYISSGFIEAEVSAINDPDSYSPVFLSTNYYLLDKPGTTTTKVEGEIGYVNIYLDKLKVFMNDGFDSISVDADIESDNPDYDFMFSYSVEGDLFTIYYNYDEETDNNTTFTYNIPIGSYIDFHAEANPTCGLASENEIIEIADNPSSFYSIKKTDAQIIWFGNGFLTYKFPNYFIIEHEISEISFELEICSEAPFYNMNFKSDITIWINDIEVATYTSPSDFGDRRGKLTPQWWGDNFTQYGELKRFTVSTNGVFIDNVLISEDIKLSDLNIIEKQFISFKIGNKDDSVFKGGLNLFGSKFGDYEQDITMQIICK